MNSPHYEDETEPGDVRSVVLQRVLLEPLVIWIVVEAKFTFNLHSKKIKYGAKHLSEEDEQLEHDPYLRFGVPSIAINLLLINVLLVENGVHDGSHVKEQFDCVENAEGEPVFRVDLGGVAEELHDGHEYVHGVRDTQVVDHELRVLVVVRHLVKADADDAGHEQGEMENRVPTHKIQAAEWLLQSHISFFNSLLY